MRMVIKPVWVDINGKEYYNVKEIDDRYLTNIVNFCRSGRVSKPVPDIAELCDEALRRGIIDDNECQKLREDYHINWEGCIERDNKRRADFLGLELDLDYDGWLFRRDD